MNGYNILSFIIGAVVGCAATALIMKKKYSESGFEVIETVKRSPRKDISDDVKKQVKEMKERYTFEEIAEKLGIDNLIVREIVNEDKKVSFNKDEETNQKETSDKDVKEYVKYVKMYTNNDVKVDDIIKPYVIPPESFDTMGYKVESLMWYSNHILTDDMDNVIEDDMIDNLIGKDALNHFGEYEEDCVYVRDDVKKVDYEILLSLRDFDPNREYRVN